MSEKFDWKLVGIPAVVSLAVIGAYTLGLRSVSNPVSTTPAQTTASSVSTYEAPDPADLPPVSEILDSEFITELDLKGLRDLVSFEDGGKVKLSSGDAAVIFVHRDGCGYCHATAPRVVEYAEKHKLPVYAYEIPFDQSSYTQDDVNFITQVMAGQTSTPFIGVFTEDGVSGLPNPYGAEDNQWDGFFRHAASVGVGAESSKDGESKDSKSSENKN